MTPHVADNPAADADAPTPQEGGRADVDERTLPQALYELTKPGIAGFVAVTAAVSYYVAASGRPDFIPVLHVLGGTGVATGGALAMNQWVERDLDARMKRTRSRPIPSGRLEPGPALAFSALLIALGVGWLGATVGILPAVLTALSAALYIGAYTPLKRISYLATLVGAVPGAFPALIGWSAATGGIEIGGLVLFSIYFLWQLPHVLGLAWLLREDYLEVGFFLAPPTDPEGRRLGRHLVYHSISLLIVSLLPTLLGLTGWIYAAGAFLMGIAMISVAVPTAKEMTVSAARRVFLGSLLYQPALLLLLLIDTVPPGGS
ncbi:MAG TPA: heme o synthase [Longimicrobiales bacterium]|nr:heme o synthase [Longimicrobiales bacterium]